MAILDSAKVDLLFKKLFGVAKTDTPTNKGASNESIASPAINRGDKIWTQASSIPGTAAAVAGAASETSCRCRRRCAGDGRCWWWRCRPG